MKLFHSRSILLIFLFTSFSPSIARDTITPTQPLADNETLISSGGQFALGFFTPANSERQYIGMWFNKIGDQKIVWVANRASPVINSTGLLPVTANGTVMITDKKSSTIVWSIGYTTSGSKASVVQLLDNGNLVLKQDDDDNNTQRYAWQSFDYPTDTLLQGMKLGLDRITGLSRNVTAWKNETDPSEGEYCLVNTDINIYLYSRSGKVWRSGQLDGIVLRSKGIVYSKLNNSQEVLFSFEASEQPTIFVVSRLGKVQLLTWQSDSRQWDTLWEEPGDQCDIYGQCGTYGICNIRTTPICQCLQGFVPKNPDKWASAVWTNGCIRKTELDCRNGTDGFVQISGVKLPDSPITFTGSEFSLDDCRLMCLHNCSCAAYAMYPGEIGCRIWMTDRLLDVMQKDGFQRDLHLRIAYADLVSSTQSQKSKFKMVVILAPLLSGLVLLITCATYFIQKIKRRRKSGTNFLNGKSNESNEDLDIPLFEFGTIEVATDYFRDENTLGQGGFGTVYKGKLANNQEIAVKRLGRTSLQGVDEFKNEVVVIAKLQNRNLVRLLGYCIQAEERILIYEYMPNKSLDFFLFGKEKGAILDWRTRYQIVIGITRGLLYLHHDSRFRIIHRDLKASNILLDKTMNPKISDFGMARLFGGDDTDFKTNKVVGTYGYMSPEYVMGGIFSLKSDVYSYGVIILEIISGKKNSRAYPFPPYINLVAHAWNLWNEGKAFELVDESMDRSFSEVEVLRCIKVGLLCVQELPADRPLMSSVMVMLGADSRSLPEPTQPGFIKTEFSKLDQNSSKQDPQTSNDWTITVLDAR